MKNNIDGSDINVGSIDEDIKIVKELVENKEKYEIPDGYKTHYCIGFTMIKSIENVLSEVEEYQEHKKYHCEQLEKVLSEIESYKNRENKELEKYKRLAEANLKDAEEFKNNMCEHRCLIKSELEETKETLKCTQDSWYKDTQELETYKKIAEKLAERYIALENRLDETVEIDDDYCNFDSKQCFSLREKSCYQCVLDWARKEVEK